jgi:hypothetical protein
MRINDNLSAPIVVHAERQDWVLSPAAGVDRANAIPCRRRSRPRDVDRALCSASAFPRHTHGGGEEVLVLEGVFQDEHGDYPAGSCFRNPPGTSHVPATREDCTVFVRLWQFRERDNIQIVCQPGEGQHIDRRSGARSATVLFDDGHEMVWLEEWSSEGTLRSTISVGWSSLFSPVD